MGRRAAVKKKETKKPRGVWATWEKRKRKKDPPSKTEGGAPAV